MAFYHASGRSCKVKVNMRLSFIIHLASRWRDQIHLSLIRIPPKKFTHRSADGPTTMTRQTVQQLLMDLNIPTSHGSCFFLRSASVTSCVNFWGEGGLCNAGAFARELNDTASGTVSLDWVTVLSADEPILDVPRQQRGEQSFTGQRVQKWKKVALSWIPFTLCLQRCEKQNDTQHWPRKCVFECDSTALVSLQL